ncbi:MAG: DegV family protein [Lachnospiraceae bacterium]|nr:DegV family protein [Lachnospiraceae bacterium]
MREYILSCCSTADLTKEHFEERNIKYICFHYEMDGKQYSDDLGVSMTFEDFYQAMKDGADTKTSQINEAEFTEYFELFLKEGKDIIHFCLSSGITGVVNSANIAKNELEEKYPDRKIYIVDTLAASGGYGLLMDKAADMRDSGMSIEELYQWAEENKLKMHHWFFTSDLTFFIKGGRVSKTAGFVGGILGICPLLNVSYEGKLIPRFKIRGKKKVIQQTFEQMKMYAQDRENYSEKCYITNAACYEDAKALADLIEAYFPKMEGKVLINYIGTTIGSHTGPGTVALFFWGDERVD